MKAVIFIHVLYLILIKTFMVKGDSKCESKVELRAVLLSCPTKDTGCDDDDPLSQAMKSQESEILQANSKNFEYLREEKERGFSNAVKDCKRKLVITLKVKNVGKLPCDDEYIIVDHVFDPVTGGRGRLLSPVVLKLRQEQMIQLYGLQFQRVVNSNPFEEQKPCGQTCSVNPDNPTCGVAMYDGKPIPYSEGFCCSCDPHLNPKRQLSPTTRGDSLLYGDHKLISQGSSHFIREKKATIVNPNLVKLKSGSSNDMAEGKKGSDYGRLGDMLACDKIPNYLLEHDRKVVCDRGDFLNELCKLQENKYYAESPSGENYRSKGGDGDVNNNSGGVKDVELKKRDLTTVAVDMGLRKGKNEQPQHFMLLKNFVKRLNMDQSAGEEALSDNYGPVKGSRGKRENRNEDEKLTLEEKLDRFVNSKNHLTSRRKRLLELSHKRRQIAGGRCLNGQKFQSAVASSFMQDDYVKTPPPKYFFFHDKYIVNPLDHSDIKVNSTCNIAKKYPPYEETKEKMFEVDGKNEMFNNKEDKGEKLSQDPFYQRQLKGENRLKKEEKFALGKFNNKKDRVSHNEGGEIENSIGRGSIRSEDFDEDTLSNVPFVRNNKRFSRFQGEEDSEFKDDEKEGKAMLKDHPKEQKSRIYSKSLKNLFHKSSSDDTISKPKKIRNFFTGKSRERQKLKLDTAKGHKKLDLTHKESDFRGKTKNLKDEQDKFGNTKCEEKESPENEKEKGNVEELEKKENHKRIEEDYKNSENTPVPYSFYSQKNPLNKEVTPEPEAVKQQNAKNTNEDNYENFNKEMNYMKQPNSNNENFNKEMNYMKQPNLNNENFNKEMNYMKQPNLNNENFNKEMNYMKQPNLNNENFNKEMNYMKQPNLNNENFNKEMNYMKQPNLNNENFNKEMNYMKQPNLNNENFNKGMNYMKQPNLNNENFNKEMNYMKQPNLNNENFNKEMNYMKQPNLNNENFNKETNYMKQPNLNNDVFKPKPAARNNFAKALGSDFSVEIIRRKSKYSPKKNTLHDILNSDNIGHFGKFTYVKNKQNLFRPPQKYYLFDSDISPHHMYVFQNEKNPLSEFKSRQQGHLKEPEIDFYDTMKQNNRFQSEYNPYLQEKPLWYHRLPEHEYSDNDLWKQSQTVLTSHDSKLRIPQLRGKRYSDLLRRHENGYVKVGYRPESLEVSMHPRREKVRSKRSASYSFQLARGFFKSEFDSQKPDERILHELETCLPEAKARVKADGWVGRPANWQVTRLKRENLSVDANGISSSQRFNCPLVTSKEKIFKPSFDKQRLIQSYLNAPDYVLKEIEATFKEKRQACPNKSQQNGSRDGENSIAGEYSQDTAHCMRFGDMWYSLYAIKRPVISQTVGIQLFDKHSLWDGTSQWRELTKGKMVRVGTFLPKAEDELPSISISFIGGKTEKVQAAIDTNNYFLLIPSHVSDPSKINLYPQFEGGPAEYLLVPSKDISSGGECNMIGTSFEAFARQPDRCNQEKGSCLKRQPVDLWREDMEARIRGKRGKYFVENFGTVPNSSIKTYTNLTGEFLALEYYGEYSSTIEIEVKADSNVIVRKGSNAQIPLVYIDSTYPKKTRIILSVLNIGLTSSYFRPRLGDCPPDLDPAWCPLEGPLVTIPPQQRHDFKLDLSGSLPSRQILVSVQVLNQVNKKIACRKITIKKGDRCVCAFYCKCNCIGNSAEGRACRRLSLRDYRKAGYIGSLPFRGNELTTSESIIKNIHIVFITTTYMLLLLGLMKGIVGVFVRRIGIIGVRIITGPRELCGYYECELQSCSVLYDEYGFPVHPTTCQPVQIVPLWVEIILNFFFFFLYPLRGLWFLLLSLPWCSTFCPDCESCGKRDEGDSDQKSSRPLLSKEFNSTCVHYNLTTVNTKKPKQEFPSYAAYKGDDDPLEEDDTEFVLQEMKRYRKE